MESQKWPCPTGVVHRAGPWHSGSVRHPVAMGQLSVLQPGPNAGLLSGSMVLELTEELRIHRCPRPQHSWGAMMQSRACSGDRPDGRPPVGWGTLSTGLQVSFPRGLCSQHRGWQPWFLFCLLRFSEQISPAPSTARPAPECSSSHPGSPPAGAGPAGRTGPLQPLALPPLPNAPSTELSLMVALRHPLAQAPSC